jgi:hypothetical protein
MKSMIVAITLMAVASAIAQKTEPSRMPYADMHRMITLNFRGMEGLTNQTVTMKITSDLPQVGPEQIKLFVDAKSGKIPIPMNPDGTFSFPVRDDLLKENPMIVANQPKGTLNVAVVFTLRGTALDTKEVSKGRARYGDLFIVENAKARLLTELKPLSANGYDFRKALAHSTVVELKAKGEGMPPSLTIETTNGVMKVHSNAVGKFVLEFNAELARQNPWVQMSTNHEWSLETGMEEKMPRTEQPRPSP